MTRTIAIANHKGGVGKTTSVVSLGAALAGAGRRVLLVDLDPQANLTQTLRVQSEHTIYKALKGDTILSPVEVTPGMSVIPSEFNLLGWEAGMEGKREPNLRLRRLLSPLRGFDYILIDTAPSLGLLSVNAFCAASEVFIPMTAQPLALNGAAYLTEAIGKVRTAANPQLRLSGVFITMYDSRMVIQREMAERISQAFGPVAFKTRIRTNVALTETPMVGQDIFRYDSKCNGAQDYRALSVEVMEQEKM